MRVDGFRMPARPASPTLLLTLAALWACGGAGSAAHGPGEVDVALSPEPIPLYTLGGVQAEGWQLFGSVTHPAFTPEGHLVFLDGQAMRIHVVDRQGEAVTAFGRRGNGPGELGAVLGMTVLEEGRIVVSDVGNRGLQLFGPNGAHQALVPFEGTNFAGSLLPESPGWVLSRGSLTVVMAGSGPVAPPTTRPVVRFSLETGRPDTLYHAWMMPPPEGPAGAATTIQGPAGQRITLGGGPPLRAFEPGLHVAALPDGRLAVADSVGYRIKLIRDGEVVGVLERPIPPARVTPEIQEAERRRRLEGVERMGVQGRALVQGPGGAMPFDARQMERERIASMVFADEIPVIERLAVDPEGRIWVQRTGPRPGVDGPTDLLTPEGRYLGTIPSDGLRIPAAFGPDGLLVYVTRDEMEVPVLEVRQLPADFAPMGR